MNVEELSKEIQVRTGIKRMVQIVLAVSVCANLVMAVGVVQADRTHRETIVPAVINKSFWVEDTKVSPSYLEEMGLFVIRNALDATPSSVEFNHKQILKYSSPKVYGALQKQLNSAAARMKELNVSTFFGVTGVQPNEAESSVALHGNLTTMLGDKIINNEAKVYVVVFQMANGKIVVNEIRESANKALPFDVPASAPAQ